MNATAQHTPGEWSYDAPYIVASDPAGIHPDIYIAEIATEDSEGRIASDEQQEANADLIAEAPRTKAAYLETVSDLVRLKGSLHRGVEAAQEVVSNWSAGNLAAAVNALETWAGEAQFTLNEVTGPAGTGFPCDDFDTVHVCCGNPDFLGHCCAQPEAEPSCSGRCSTAKFKPCEGATS